MTINSRQEELQLEDGGKYKVTKLGPGCAFNMAPGYIVNQEAVFKHDGYNGEPAFIVGDDVCLLGLGYEVEPV
jgi:hypothetical protein